MNKQIVELLVVDDEEFIRDLLQELLSEAGYSVVLAADGEEAWEILSSKRHNFAAILLDRMMPRLDGMGLLARIKADRQFVDIPVIFQTAIDQPAEIAEGIKAGAFYYLIKPLDIKVLYAIVQSAANTFQLSGQLREAENKEQSNLSRMLISSTYKFRTLEEARTLATALSACYPHPQRVFLGISELLINAVEHGNLAISYEEKSRLLQEGRWDEEIVSRLNQPEFSKKIVDVRLEQEPSEIRLSIRDGGDGFDCRQYMKMSPERAFDPNGRGIAMSRMTSFDSLEYLGKGNELVAIVNK